MKLYSCSSITWIEGLSPRPPIGESVVFESEWEEKFWYERGFDTAGLAGDELQKIAEEIIRRETIIQQWPQWWEVYMDFYNHFIEAGRSPYGATSAALKIVLDLMFKYPAPKAVPMTAVKVLTIGAAVAVALVVVLYVFNPTKKYRVVRTYESGRYVLGIGWFLWWADIIGHTPTGRAIYTLCNPVGGTAEGWRRAGEREGEPGTDEIRFFGSWRESWFDFPHWYQRQYESMELGFVGLCWNLGGGQYVLRLAHEDEYVGGIEVEKELSGRETCSEPEYSEEETLLAVAEI